MPRTALTPVNSPGQNAVAFKEFTWAAGDASNGNSVVATGRELILARNMDTSVQTLTLRTVNGQVSYTLPAKGGSPATEHFLTVGTVPLNGFKQPDGNLWIDVTNSLIELVVLVMP